MGLEALFSPRAVAVIGASDRELTIGYRIIQNLLDLGCTGPVYPANPKGGRFRGSNAYPSVLDTPEDVAGGATDVPAPG
jgi:acetyltransferase